ncbi:unnamed protein product [Amoebophrya sp. A25]|nr:unnamed protein product [Amoebophrya sp. A25]|eukprot:GSA25T00021453001.1
MVSDQETMAGVFKSSLPNSGTRIRPLLLSSKYGGEPSGIRIRPFLLASLSRKMRGAVDRLVAIVAAVSSSKSPRSRDALVLKRRKNRKARTTVARALFGFLCLCFCAIVVLKLGSELALLRQGETTSVCVEDVSRSTTATSLEAKRSISSSAISAPATSTSATTSRTDISETTTAATENPLVGFFDFPRRTFAALSEVPLSITIYFDSLSDFLTLPILGAHAIGFIDGPHPLHCPTKFEELFDAVQTGASLYNQAEVGQAKRVLTEYIVKWANTDPLVGMECSLGMAAAYRTLTFAYCANPHTNNRRAYQIGLRILHQAMNWITHVFVKSQHDADMIDGSKWPITIQQINDELTIIQNVLKQDNIPNGHQVHPRLAPGLIQHDFKPTASSWMSSGENRHKIGIVSLCAYPEDHVLPRYAMSNHQIYAKKHGYSYFVETQRVDPKRPHAWGKIALLEQQLLLPDGPEWLLWFDCDTYFMNMTTTIESVLYRYAGIPKDELASREAGAASQANKIATQPRFETKSKIYSVDDVVLDPTVHLIIAEDNAMLNSGTFFVKKSEWSVNLMRQIWGDEKTSPWVDHPWWENAALTWFC